MVWESHYWKKRLDLLASEIEMISEKNDTSDLDVSNLEISIFAGFFLIRKLIEAQTKLSYSIENQNVNCSVSEKIDGTPPVDILTRFDIDKLYDLDGFGSTKKNLNKMCNIFVHSIFLWMIFDEDGFISGVHLTSSYEKEKYIYQVNIQEILRVFSSVINDEQSILEIKRDPITKELRVKKG